MSSKVVQSINLRRISAEDNAAIAHVIRQVSAEYGLTADKGYTVADPNLDELYQVYSQPGHAYWVVDYNGETGTHHRDAANPRLYWSAYAALLFGDGQNLHGVWSAGICEILLGKPSGGDPAIDAQYHH